MVEAAATAAEAASNRLQAVRILAWIAFVLQFDVVWADEFALANRPCDLQPFPATEASQWSATPAAPCLSLDHSTDLASIDARTERKDALRRTMF